MNTKEWSKIHDAICDIGSCNVGLCPLAFVDDNGTRNCRALYTEKLDADCLAETLRGCSDKYIVHKIERDKRCGTDSVGVIFSAMKDTIVLE